MDLSPRQEEEARGAAKRLLQAKGLWASDCHLVRMDSWLEMHTPNGKRLAIVALTLDGKPADAWSAR